MKRLRLVFALLAVLLAVPTLLFVRHTRESLRVEHELRHRAVAARVFDEMERALSVWLAEEDARPTGHYRYYTDAIADGIPDGSRTLSPLASDPARPFVTGYFQIDPDGSFHTPEQPRDVAAARRRGDYSPNPERAEALETIQRRVGEHFATWNATDAPRADAEESRDDAASAKRQAPGTTRTLSDERQRESVVSPLARDALERTESELDVYSTLSSLNQAAESRKERKTKRVAKRFAKLETAPGATAPLADAAELAESPPRADAAGLAEPPPRAAEAAPPPEPSAPEVTIAGRSGWNDGFLGRARADPTPKASARAGGGAKRRSNEAPARGLSEALPGEVAAAAETALAHLEIEPLRGYHLADGQLMLMRSVRITHAGNEQRFYQGLLVDPAALHRWLREDALASAKLGAADFVFRRTGDPPEAQGGAGGAAYRAVHRFAEPFDAWELELGLAPLAGLRTEGPLLWLPALVLFASALGLFALYRMVSVRLQFAERRSNFAAAVSHELKTPLTAIRMYAEMLRDGMVPDESKRREYYASITAEAERLSRLINNVLEYSKLEQNERTMKAEVGNPGPVVHEVMRWLTPHAEGQGFALDVRVAADIPDVRFERDALLQILFNLIDNSIKYARESEERTVHVSCGRHGDAVVVAVRDHGPGVSHDHL
ncbi:MAG: HAMP domain-containing histidine kinase, partial [Myxococcales bacterium]|nr:HAMP domain-containing histidine kinase [Myxococcales bacterium]